MDAARLHWARAALALLALLLLAALARAQDVLPVPELTARVIDQTGTLDPVQRQGIEERLAQIERGKGSQVVFLMVPTTQPEDIASYANRVANTWKIGRREVGDGVLLIVAKDDRRVRIEVAKTLEGAIPDLAARQIIEDAITPAFRRGDYAGGLQAAADQIAARINNEPLPAPQQQRTPGGGAAGAGGFNFFDLAIFLFFAVPIAGAVLRGVFGRKLGALVTGGGVGGIALLITSSLVVAGVAGLVALLITLVSGGFGAGLGGRRRGYGGGWVAGPYIGGGFGGGGWGGGAGGFGGGGFGSGGGGDFGGGGASGDW
ncbi:TPM domain-containing protein [Ramlibacter tataouinensis]|uniref:Candidate membrane protein n=1 Tax=Ramlibacter tataouinensis (strain ATCC BAA-407 / DSM 14655 / LMG 21543 / TTB310) TaxID=365046 RepID=F5Y5D5_RAMTT|nr:TPM domain-containing protein [Ramlibacter tataouinensis]AEG91445.1 candidate membrane protein [Ramlibacter tataouinensis TTB310]